MTTRVLALCGFTQNSYIYSKQLGAIRKTCKNTEFVFLEPPFVVQKADMPWNAGSLEEFNSTATTEEEQQTPETTPRGWWISGQSKDVIPRFDESISYVRDFLIKNGPFDGIMGFSQGGCMAAIITALLEKPGLHPAWPADERLKQFKFVISVGGFVPLQSMFDGWFPIPKHVPALVVIGRTDVVVHEERALTMLKGFENARVEYHPGGHFTPSKASWRHFFNAYITAVAKGEDQNEVPPVNSFGPSGTNTPASASGANTPVARPGSPRVPAAQAAPAPSALSSSTTPAA